MIELLDRKSKVAEEDVKTLVALKSGETTAGRPQIRTLDETGDTIIHTHNGEAITAKTPDSEESLVLRQSMILCSPLVRPEPGKLTPRLP